MLLLHMDWLFQMMLWHWIYSVSKQELLKGGWSSNRLKTRDIQRTSKFRVYRGGKQTVATNFRCSKAGREFNLEKRSNVPEVWQGRDSSLNALTASEDSRRSLWNLHFEFDHRNGCSFYIHVEVAFLWPCTPSGINCSLFTFSFLHQTFEILPSPTNARYA